jgi:hypothetical protein
MLTASQAGIEPHSWQQQTRTEMATNSGNREEEEAVMVVNTFLFGY